MGIEEINKLEKERDDVINNINIGKYISASAIIIFICGFIWDGVDHPELTGVILGGGLVFWGVNKDRLSKIRRDLDDLCHQRYHKGYSDSFNDILDEKYPE